MPEAVQSSCHGGGSVAPTVGEATVAFIGCPNVGKTTLFNAVTGLRRSVGNWPGTTVETGRGRWHVGDERVDVIDLPGTYSLDPQSPDEALTRSILVDAPAAERPAAVVIAADAVDPARSLYLCAQVRELDLPVVVALTMNDVAARRGAAVDAEALAAGLGCPVVAVDPRRGTGVEELATAVADALRSRTMAPRPTDAPADDELAAMDDRFAWIEAALAPALATSPGAADGPARPSASERIDRIVLHPIAGPLVFLAAMWAVFQLTTIVAAPLQNGLDALFSGPVTDAGAALLAALGIDHPLVTGLVLNGLVAGVGMLLTFAPLMAIMFALLAALEDSGYMARAAVVADRAMRALGLPGRAFLPLIVGFGCNVPAISATRVLSDTRQRILTALLVPFTSCSARLTVYVMLAGTFFPEHAGTVVFAMYVISILLVIATGFALRRTLWRTMGSAPLVMDLPAYQVPSPRILAAGTWVRLRGFLQTAGGVIVATVIVVFALQSIPATGDHALGEVPPEDSLYAAGAQAVAPVLAPAGFGDWRTAGTLVTGFVAKEAVISSWAQTYALEDPSSLDAREQGSSPLAVQLRATFADSSGGHTGPAVWAFLVFLLAYTPCVATLAAQRREIGLRWTVFGVAMQLCIAWTLAVAVFQIGRLIW